MLEITPEFLLEFRGFYELNEPGQHNGDALALFPYTISLLTKDPDSWDSL